MTTRSIPVAMVILVLVAGCAIPAGLSPDDDRVQVVTTTGILRDLVAHVGGSRVRVSSIVPDGGDPHTYEPSLRRIRDVVYADAAFSNYLLLEPHAVVSALDANLPEGAVNVPLAEEAVRYGVDLIPLVEDASLDTIWLGLRVDGDGAARGADRSSLVELTATEVDGPGELVAYLTGAFGRPETTFDSTDGFDADDPLRHDTAVLPVAAHTHMSWAFTRPGVYRLRLSASLRVTPESRPRRLATGTVTFAVGVDAGVAGAGRDIVDDGHADVTVDVDAGALRIVHDPSGGDPGDRRSFDPSSTTVVVPNRARQEVPADPAFRFLGDAGAPVYVLPQAVLGRHVHGEIDPHLWHDVGNAIAYVAIIRDTLVALDPAGAGEYRTNAATYTRELEVLDAEVRSEIAEIPAERRHLVTTHDAFRYLGRAYGLAISGFVTPNPAVEPSLADRRRLAETIDNLDVPAVFLEPNLAARSSTLNEVAADAEVSVCPIHGDVLDDSAPTYTALMRANARSLRRCLSR